MNSSRRTGTFFFGMIIEAAWTWVHRRDQHKTGRKIYGYFGPAYCYPPFFHGLPHNLQHAAFELWQFIEKQYTIMGQRNFTGLWYAAAANQCHIAGCMMWRTEWPSGN